ncbi:MAG: GxxExxY protein [Ignavibacteriae bacterium]|nr:GxxExxY protein [Ignavibacteriota bacterium]
MLHQDITDKIINAFYTVYNTLGSGFLEKVYENAFVIELEKKGLHVEQQKRIDVFYKGKKVGEYFADICVEGLVVLELKAAEGIAPEHEAQLINYLKATNIELGFLFNFGPKPIFIRRILTNDKKGINHG